METNKNNPGKIEKSILSQNKIPGCDQLTRPEEIKALSKYLGNIRKVQEKHTTLQKDNLEIPGRTTGRIPKVELPNFVDPLSESRSPEKAKIYGESSRVPLERNHEPRELNKAVVGLEDKRKISLGKEKENLEVTKETTIKNYREELKKKPGDPEIKNYREGLEDKRKISLNKKRENLEDIREVTLQGHQEKLEDTRETNLSSTRIGLKDVNNTTELKGYRETLEDSRDTTLSEYRESLTDNRETSLENYRESLTDDRKISLGEYKESLTDDRETVLSKVKKKLENIESLKELGGYREPLIGAEGLESYTIVRAPSGEEENLTELPDTVEPLKNVEKTEELSGYKDPLYVEDNTTIDNYKEPLDYGNNLDDVDSLENYKESLTDDRDTTLGNYRDPLVDDRNTELSDTVEPLNFGDNLGDDDNFVEDHVEPLDFGDNLEGIDEVGDYVEPLDFGDRLGDDDNFVEDHVEPLNFGDNLGEVTDLRGTVISIGDGVPNDVPPGDYVEPLDFGDRLGDDDNFVEDHVEPLNFGDRLGDDDNFVEDHVEPLDFGERLGDDDNFVEDYVEPLDFGDRLGDDDNFVEDHVEPLNFGDNLGDDDNFVEDHVERLTDDRETSLEDFIDKLTDDRETELPDVREELPETSQDSPRQEGDYNYFSADNGGELYTESIELSPHEDGNRSEGSSNYLNLNSPEESYLYEESIERPEPDRDIENYIPLEEDEEAELPYSEAIERPEAGQDSPRQEGDYNYIDPSTAEIVSSMSDLTGDELYNKAMEFMKETETAEWEKKIQSLVSSYLSGSIITPEQAEEFEQKLGREIKVAEVLADLPPMKLPSFSLDSLNLNNYLRYVTEKTVGQINNKGIREALIQETLMGLVWARNELEKVSKSNRDRLPGGDGGLIGDLVSGGVSGALDNLGNRLGNSITNVLGKSNSVNMDNPVNRPDDGIYTEGWTSTGKRISQSQVAYSSRNNSELEVHKNIVGSSNDGSSGGSSSFWKKVGQVAKETFLGGDSNNQKDYTFVENYLKGSGIKTTVEELCENSSSISSMKTVGDLFNALKSSQFITTPGKFSSDDYSGYKVQTLDSDSYWEMILEPYVGEENGGLSYLPGLHEINLRNIAQHGVNTGYNRWIPFQGFDLQKSKMTNKTLQLYDGEISYPVSMEFTNEFRITIADDQYKSWRTYFEECAKTAIYNSEGHNESFYSSGEELTAIDTSNVVVAMYKNITFRCQLYIMTPQFSTIHKYDLLLVMKDFSEEHTGSIDGGASDLTVSFSIVGENPSGDATNHLGSDRAYGSLSESTSSGSLLGNVVGSIVEHGVNTVIGLIK